MTPDPSGFRPQPATAADLNAPAIGLLIAGVVGVLSGLLQLGSGLMQLFMKQQGAGSLPTDPSLPPFVNTYLKAMSSGVFSLAFAMVVLVVNGVIVYGGLQMREARQYAFAVAAAALCCVPCCFHSCCSVFVVPLGIWALTVLLGNGVKAQFHS